MVSQLAMAGGVDQDELFSGGGGGIVLGAVFCGLCFRCIREGGLNRKGGLGGVGSGGFSGFELGAVSC